MPAPPEVLKLIERFDLHREEYLSDGYNETQIRREFLDPFFEALGWDVNNRQGHAEAYKDVVHEDAIKVGGDHKAPDYGFRIGGTRKFFLEAKKPRVKIREEIEPAFQLRRYAWSAKLPLSILSDFEEFAVYDCRIKPNRTDKASVARIMYLNYTEYAERWDEIASVFSRDAILKGSFDRFAESNKKKRGTAEVDAAFLEEIESWRAELARNLALRNADLSQRDLNFAVQRIIDRIIFLRIAEDRAIEDYGRLRELVSGDQVYRRLCELFRHADDRYNSGLFHFEREKDRVEPPDDLTLLLSIDDKVLKPILKHLYYPDSPYEFSVLPADILGQVYEQFLGKVITLDARHRAVVEDKPEVKKAGGVYYTPTYIVDYIVRQTIGKLLEGKTPKQAAKLRVLDPACGSGSFLIGAYQFLLDWHLDYYLKAKEAYRKEIYQGDGGVWRLTTAERKRILLANVYGVDIDAQAVEVTKLSLLLKVLEGENRESLERQLKLFHRERALPDLGANIKCGNSLIGPDFYDQQQMALFDEEERYRINVFDWKAEFPAIMKAGGFDAVIGNPPYVRIQSLQRESIDYLTAHYSSAVKNADLYVSFVERAYQLLSTNGRFGNILPNKFFRTDYGIGLRTLLVEERALERVVDFGASQVFEATTYTCLLFLSKRNKDKYEFAVCDARPDALNNLSLESQQLSKLNADAWGFHSDRVKKLRQKLCKGSSRLLALPAAMSRGSSSGCDDVFVFDPSEVEIEEEITRIPSFASDFGRYRFAIKHPFRIIFPYERVDDGYSLIAEERLKKRFPRAYRYLSKHRDALCARKQFKEWYAFSAPRNLVEHESAHLAIPLLADRGIFATIPSRERTNLCPMASGGFTIRIDDPVTTPPEYLLACLNSKLLFWELQQRSNVFRGGWITCTKQYVGELPIKDVQNKQSATTRDGLVSLVNQITSLVSSMDRERSAQMRVAMQRQITTLDRQIDQLVYQLYGLTDEEIALVEASTEPAGTAAAVEAS